MCTSEHRNDIKAKGRCVSICLFAYYMNFVKKGVEMKGVWDIFAKFVDYYSLCVIQGLVFEVIKRLKIRAI